MKKAFLLAAMAFSVSLSAFSQEKKEITKTGLNFGPLPAVAFDADKGLQYGALLNIYNFGDGTNYPNYDSKWYFESSFFSKGSKLFILQYDNKVLIPGVRWSSSITTSLDKAMDFYGFNGYRTFYDEAQIAAGKAGDQFLFSPFYRMSRIQVLASSDFTGHITDNLLWEAGYHAGFFKQEAIDRDNINKGKTDSEKYPDTLPTLFENYRSWGLISDDEADGGFVSSVRLGLMYDTRDKEGAPTRGIWAEGHITAAPSWLGTKNAFSRYSVTFRQYFPIIDNDKLTFAYRLNYEGTLGEYSPYYVLPYITVMGENCDKDGMGGYRTVRGMMRNRVVGLDMASYTAEMRWRFLSFSAFNQNIALGLSAFSDGAMVTRERDMSFNGKDPAALVAYNAYMSGLPEKDTPHITVGVGFRFIMNQNFIVALEYGSPISHFYSNSNPLHNQDGTGAFYINTGYLF